MRLNEIKEKTIADLKLEYSGTGNFTCAGQGLTSLVGSPTLVNGSFLCNHNKLKSLVGAPEIIDGYFSCQNNRLTSLKDVHKHIKQIKGYFYAIGNPIKSHVLGVLLIKGLNNVYLDNYNVQEILNSHLPSRGMRDVLEAQEELIDAGFGAFAEL